MKTIRLVCLTLVLTILIAGCRKKPTATTTPLHRAARAGEIERVRSLISSGADVNAKDNVSRTPLHYAADHNRAVVAEMLISNGADVNARDWGGFTPLHVGARRGHYNIVELLLAKGADSNARNRKGLTAMDCATEASYADVVSLLRGDGDQNAKMRANSGQDDGLQSPVEPLTDAQAVVLSNSVFAFDLYRQVRHMEGNLFFSPYSISTALAMTYAGARGETEKQMAEVLHFSLGHDDLHPAFAGLQASLNKLQKETDIELHIANSLWPQKGRAFLDEYLSLIQKHYGASITPVDYIRARESARRTINAWVEAKTDNKIKDLIQPAHLNELTRLVLTNAIYFKGNWLYPFDPEYTRSAPFYISPKESVQAPMMVQKENFRYAEFKSVQIVELPYAGENLSMLVILPIRIEGLERLDSVLSTENLDFWRRNLKDRKVHVVLPKFEMTWEIALKPTLQSMGMIDAFAFPGANFAGFDGDPKWYFIGEVVHKAYVNVNEKGTEAAAATAVVMGLGGAGSPLPVFRADHPFLFLIQDRQTGTILFIGRVTDPTKTGK